jgi:HEAT repeat protein
MMRHTIRSLLLAAAAFGVATGVHSVAAQSLERRIADVRDGTIHLSYAARPGVCGDGRDAVESGRTVVVFPSIGSYGRGDIGGCLTGPVRVSLEQRGGEMVSLRVHVGGRWAAPNDATDLGTVSAPDAARHFLREATRLDGRNAEYALGAAVLADSVSLWPDLLRLIRSADVGSRTRQRAVFWLATYDEPGARTAIRQIIEDVSLDQELRGAAIIALGNDDISGDDIAFLRQRYPSLSPKLRDDVFLAVSRSDDPRAAAWLASVVTSADESEHTREQAMFWLGQGQAPTSALLTLYDRLQEPALRKHYTFVLSQRHEREALEKLIDVAQHDTDRSVRRQALFWLGQSRDPRAAEFLRALVTQ